MGCQHYHLLSLGGTGGEGGGGGINSGGGGMGEGPTVIFDNSTNKMYVGEISPVLFPKVLSQQQQCESGSRVNQISHVEYFSS
jgi:hypothetical protein